ncbi:MAG TPA: M23 family metallopeptidase [Thermoanaerobaculia bacterium]|nr:M23 family metallopeptidase [Thermoanaerobaculia bacterium]
MAVFNLFLSTILLPFIAVILLWRRPRRPIGPWLTTLAMSSGVVGFSVLAAPWGFFGVPVRIVLMLAYATALGMSLRRPIAMEAAVESPARMLVKVAIGFFFGGVALGVLRAHELPPHSIDLGFPLRGGTFLVLHGGSTPAANAHFADAKQRYAVDFVKLYAAGFRARGFFPSDPHAYAIYGAEVVSPCDGSVLLVRSDAKDPLGTNVVLRCGDADVVLAQLVPGSVVVRAGARVARGALLARAGNSGASPEPHLHVHAERKGVAVPITFEGRWLVRNALVRR